ncbi:gfo/Idh/MocA family oxidoreductase [Nakamurella sp. YIM 132087]|uniref:Gfo/Idh/MocA family oxidoreductase n=1 Tax=Nakamurella alba TaxID=2665158 RepID=A0A7K1FKT1_9ACTN|nr:Gfo/Idh/MocA family oxidoreductase [Nakamurella alba]MTD14718.1 gfo/Idh/MocA family oxidoreductase [Nakamurella alba]
MVEGDVRFGVVGYGAGGRFFHSPFLQAAEGVSLSAVLARSAEKQALVRQDLPGTPVVDTLADLVGVVDAVVITTPPATRRALVLEALSLGLHVVADKPFAPDADIARELRDAANDAGLLLTPYHNRRWDPDFRTVQGLLAAGQVGEPVEFESRFDLYEPWTIEGGPGGGVLSDLGSHLIDQAFHLCGPVERVRAELQPFDTDRGPSDAAFVMSLTHTSGVISRLRAGKVGRATGRELRLSGTEAGYRSLRGTDVLPTALFAGGRPGDDGWGAEVPERWGELVTADGVAPVPSATSSWEQYYEQFARAVRGTDVPPVTADEAIEVVRIIDAARRSAEQDEVVLLRG